MDWKGKINFEILPQILGTNLLSKLANEWFSLTEKTSTVGEDLVLLEDSQDGYSKKKVKISNLIIFGSQFQYAENLSVGSTTSNTFVQRLRLTTTSVPAGNYRIAWSFSSGSDADDKPVGSRVQVDDTTTLSEFYREQKGKATDVPAAYFPVAGSAIVTLTAGSHFIDVDYAIGSADTAYIKDVRIEFWRVL